jgi:hypothetical protein
MGCSHGKHCLSLPFLPLLSGLFTWAGAVGDPDYGEVFLSPRMAAPTLHLN